MVPALRVVLGSLYQDELVVEPAEVVPLLATATLLQLDGVIEQCILIMEETVNSQVKFHFFLSQLISLLFIVFILDCS